MIIQPFQGCAQSNGGFCPSSSIQSHNYILSLCDHGMEWEMRGLEIGPWSTSIFLNCSSRQVDLTPTSCELSSLISTVPTDVYVCPRSLAWIVQILLGSFGSVYYIPQPTVCLSRPSLRNLQTKHRFSSLSELPNLSGGSYSSLIPG